MGHINHNFLTAGLCSVCGLFYGVFTGAVCKHLPACCGEVVVQPHQRIRALAVHDNFKMQMRSEHIPANARITDEFSLFDLLADLDAIAAQMGVSRLQGLSLVGRVFDSHHVAIALHSSLCVTVPVLRLVNRAFLCRVDRALVVCAVLRAPIGALMQTAIVVVPPLR